MNSEVIGVLGGMGTYATIHLFRQYAEIFPAEKEWDRPRIIIDNRCTMPSRVRAFLYGENRQELVRQMSESIEHLMNFGCTRIILACNTSHLFLPEIFDRVPKCRCTIVNIVENSASVLQRRGIENVYILGSEGTLDSKIYQNMFSKVGINCVVPATNEYAQLRECIEAVKQNKYSNHIKEIFLSLTTRHACCLLGCTELPVLAEKYEQELSGVELIDPLYLALCSIKQELLQ